MNVVDTLRAMVHRWYIVVPGLIVAGVLSALVFSHGTVQYERSASILLLPAKTSIPKNDNPFLYISGLGQTADVLVRAVGAQAVTDEVQDQHPDAQVTVARDPATPGPILVISVKSPVDAEAGTVLADMVGRSHAILARLQDDESIATPYQITASPVAVDTKGTPSQKTRMITTAGVGIVLVGATVLAAALVEALAGRRRSARTRGPKGPKTGQAVALPISIPAPAHARSAPPRVGGR
ncbi:hypothetical protein [Xylanimonas sp. McL0601]|uniref:hypothetical protein n=1 Tax=Xylanimonas sp. McL0601 TaxID=3414739 RepID=UPI003CFB3FE4